MREHRWFEIVAWHGARSGCGAGDRVLLSGFVAATHWLADCWRKADASCRKGGIAIPPFAEDISRLHAYGLGDTGLVAYTRAPRTLGPNSPVPTPMWRMVHPPTSESLSASPCTAPKQVDGVGHRIMLPPWVPMGSHSPSPWIARFDWGLDDADETTSSTTR